MEPDYKNFDVDGCSREQCEAMLERLRTLLSREDSEGGKLDLARCVILLQKRLTKFRIDNINKMVSEKRAAGR